MKTIRISNLNKDTNLNYFIIEDMGRLGHGQTIFEYRSTYKITYKGHSKSCEDEAWRWKLLLYGIAETKQVRTV